MKRLELNPVRKLITEALKNSVSGRLKNARFIKKLTVDAIQRDDFGLDITYTLPHYTHFIDNGAKYTNKMPPVAVIAAWARSVGIPDSAKVAWAIAKAIKKRGIKARPFLDRFVENATNIVIRQYVSDPAIRDEIFKEINNEL